MGLFSKSKEETKNDAPPVPPAPQSNAPAPAPQAPVEIQKPNEESNNLSPPPIPGGSLNDIKNEVSSKKDSKTANENEETDNNEETEDNEEKLTSNNEEDSLFDFSELDVNAPVNTQIEADKDIINPNNETEQHKSAADDADMNFIKHRHTPSKDTYFVTTHQFKSLLEIVEAVKNKVKDASETHLKLLDIKAEEDIEFENLRKDFQFIEDKLYEVDSIIFEK